MIADYIGIPFVDKGKDFDGADCYGLLQLYYKREFNIDVPDVLADSSKLKMAYLEYLDNVSKHWSFIDEPQDGCVVAMRTDVNNPKLVTHFGIILKVDDKFKILHTFKKTSSHLVDIDHPAYINKIKGFLTWHN